MSYSKNDCRSAILKAKEEIGKSPTIPEYKKLDISPSTSTIIRKFGSWPEAIESTGATHTHKEISQKQVIEDLQRIAQEKGSSPTLDDLRERDNAISTTVVYERFDNFNDAKREAGLKTSDAYNTGVNKEYFEKIDSCEKAYWLGFLFGDGSINKKRLTLCLKESDKKHLFKFKQSIESEATVGHYNDSVEISICKKKIREDLRSWNLTETKTSDGTLPNIEQELRPAFVRGLFDADGCADISKGRIRWRITSICKERLTKIYDWLAEWGVDGGGVYPGQSWHELTLSAKEDIRTIRKKIYPDGIDTKPSLERKTKILHSKL